jgi:glycerol-3-phosphate dehydrogenase
VIERAQALTALAENEFDVVVVGGGITGAGVALDAATRGFSVALIERADFAAGTSSRSSKLVHGGLRYLQNFDLGLVREALLERQLMVALAPHLVHPLPLVVPAFDGVRPDRLMGVGLNLYDVMSVDRDRLRSRRGRRARASAERLAGEQGDPPIQREEGESWSPERHRVISGEEVIELLPALAPREPTSGYLFYDCQTDDVRLVLTVLGEAERFGAVCANRVHALSLLERDGRACGVRVLDGETGAELDVRAANVVNATGVWADRLTAATAGGAPIGGVSIGDASPGGAPADLPADEPHEESELGGGVPIIRPSRGTHILLRHEDLPLVGGAIVPAGAGRTIFALPWLGRTLVGTTDRDYEGELDHVRPSAEDVDYLLSAINEFFDTAFAPHDLAGAYAGVRPLISSGDPKKSVDISRRAELYEASSGMLTITGGKLTTWRRMAKLTVDRLVARDSRDAPCRTHEIPLGQAIAADELPRVEGVPDASYPALAGRYGYAAHEVLALATERGELAQPIVPGLPDLLAEVTLAARREQARSIGDVLLRRTRLGLLAARELLVGGDGADLATGAFADSATDAFADLATDAPADPVRRVAGVLARELGWDAARVGDEIERFAAEAGAEGIRPDDSRPDDRPDDARPDDVGSEGVRSA